jgi:hypothetical protein
MATAHRPASTEELIRHSVSSWHRCAAPTRPPRTCARGRARRSPCRTSRPGLPQHASFARSRSEQPQALGSRCGGLGSLHRFVCTSCWQHHRARARTPSCSCPRNTLLACSKAGVITILQDGVRESSPIVYSELTPSAASSRAALHQDLPLLWCPSPCVSYAEGGTRSIPTGQQLFYSGAKQARWWQSSAVLCSTHTQTIQCAGSISKTHACLRIVVRFSCTATGTAQLLRDLGCLRVCYSPPRPGRVGKARVGAR